MIENTTEPQENPSDNEQLVPVTEAIRYRKRAQAAELELQTLQENYQQQQQQLSELQAEHQLSEALIAQGVNDLKVAILLGKDKSKQKQDMPLTDLVAELKDERPGLFGSGHAPVPAGPTAALRSGHGAPAMRLEQKARQVRQSGSRKDMQDYLRLRRNMTR